MSTTTNRYNNGLGIKTGFTDNTGVSYTTFPITFANASGTSSMTGTFSVTPQNNNTLVNLSKAGTGTAQIVVSATYSQIFDQLSIFGVAGASTYSIVLSGDVVAENATLNVSANKYFYASGIYNGTKFILSNAQTA